MWWLLAACSGQPVDPVPAPSAPEEVVADQEPAQAPGAAVAERMQCSRCHEAPDRWESATLEHSCVHCHEAAYTDAFDAEYTAEGIARWRRNIHSLRGVPSLVGVERLRADWLRAYLTEPHDVRPNLPATMPRFRMTPDEIDALVQWLAAEETSAAAVDGDAARGGTLMQERGCASCHAFSGAGLWDGPEMGSFVEALSLAPDLAHVRHRMAPSTVDRWLADPSALKSDTRMPPPVLSQEERRDVVAALFTHPLKPDPPGALQALPPLERPVTYAEVKEQVFDVVCQHCHAVPTEHNDFDGGPGSSGGYGFARPDLVLATWEGIHRGRLGPGGERQSILEGEDPLLVRVLHARHDEVRGKPGSIRGMPLGLEPLSAEQIRLVEAWVKQGAPK